VLADLDVTIVGAGPYGLSSAAYLKNKGVGVGTFGEPMSFWENHMPAGMFLRSNWLASHISDPHQKLTLDQYRAETSLQFKYPIPLERFVDYGKWFQSKAVPDLSRRQVSRVERNGDGFRVTLSNGEMLKARRVVVATGIAPFPWRPMEFDNLPPTRVTHSSDHRDLSTLRGKQVLVVGGGQSALDTARILSGMDGKVEIVAKQRVMNWVGQNRWLHDLGIISWCLYSNYDVGPAGLSRLIGFPNLFRQLPRGLQDRLSHRATRPAGTGWQKPYLAKVPITLDCRVSQVEMRGEQVYLKMDNGTDRLVDHVILATGYRVDSRRYGFFSEPIQKSLKTAKGHPVLARGMESSIPGLHFVGKPAAWSFGPLLNFISGSHFAGPELLRAFS